jgi:enamine deaminase RidA (YjgF/YER057c/UK114 family)
MDWITTANGIITLITGLIGLIGTGIGAYFAIKNWFTVLKTKNSQEIWSIIMTLADAAMKEAEASMKSGEDKKKMVIDSVKAGCKAAGIDMDMFIDQLSSYIDDTIKFVNEMKKD